MKTHPIIEKYIPEKSKAKTYKGKLKAAYKNRTENLTNRRRRIGYTLDERLSGKYPFGSPSLSDTFTPRYKRFSETTRIVRRAKNDPKFKKNYIKRCKREFNKLNKYDITDHTSVKNFIKSSKSRHARYEEIKKNLCAISDKIKIPQFVTYPENFFLFPVDKDFVLAYRKYLDVEFTAVVPTYRSDLFESTEYQYGREYNRSFNKKTIRRASQTLVMPSFVVLKDMNSFYLTLGRAIDFELITLSEKFQNDYFLDIDENGLRLVSSSHGGDYHISSDHFKRVSLNDLKKINLTDWVDWEYIVYCLEENQKIRQEELKQKQLLEKELEGVYVCLKDSLKAGNCKSGTLSWARRHGFVDPKRHYPAKMILNKTNITNDNRVRVAVSVAKRRHEKEIEEGICDLNYHFAN